MPDIDFVRAEIEHMRTQLGRQRKEIFQLQRAGIPTASAELLLGRMLTKIDTFALNETLSRKNSPATPRAECWAASSGDEVVPRRPREPAMAQGIGGSPALGTA